MNLFFQLFWNDRFKPVENPLRKKLFHIIFESDTTAGKRFDVWLLVAIVSSVTVIVVDSVPGLAVNTKSLLRILEWIFTIAFTLEYVLRLWIVRRPYRYALSLYGLIDLLAILPGYLSLLIAGSQYLLVVRAIRLLRVFRILKLTQFLTESKTLAAAISGSARKIAIFMMFIMILVTILGSIMYLVEGPESGYTSIPESIYWAIVTLTTVGYGDISPHSPLGKFIASVIMLCGYGIIAVPTGIVTSEITLQARKQTDQQKKCPDCQQDVAIEAKYCQHCGKPLTHP
ncbi:MAG: ion transporter [Bacteroidia bacterium]